jgi:hypothetical protein
VAELYTAKLMTTKPTGNNGWNIWMGWRGFMFLFDYRENLLVDVCTTQLNSWVCVGAAARVEFRPYSACVCCNIDTRKRKLRWHSCTEDANKLVLVSQLLYEQMRRLYLIMCVSDVTMLQVWHGHSLWCFA